MYEIKKAIIMAAGKGERLRPVTLHTPKPLIEVCGTRMIDTVIDGLLENGISEIYIVVGYMKEQFEELKERYPFIRLIENPYYDRCNNISSLYCAGEQLDEAVMIIDGDQIVRDSRALSRFFERSGYNCVFTEEHTDEWLLTLDEGIVVSCSCSGGEKGWQLYGVSRWTKSDALALRRDLEYEFEQARNKQIYWDEIALCLHSDRYRLGIFEMDKSAIYEIDRLSELAAADESYKEINI